MQARQMSTPVAPVAQRRSGGTSAVRGRLGTILVMAIAAIAILGAAYFANGNTPAEGLTSVNLTGTPTGPAPILGQTAPDFTATTIDGQAIKLSDLRGSPVWLTFGASWCQPCRAENPDIQAAYDAFRAAGLVVVQVYITEDASAVSDYAARVGLTYRKVADTTDGISTNYRILGIPSHFFIDRDGVLRQLKVGTMDPAAMQAALSELTH
jgi:cytochrome c biogenesis protein CcmG, thiol:disulfide interchange protein DsbE